MKLTTVLFLSGWVFHGIPFATPFSAPSPTARSSALGRMQEMDFLPSTNPFFWKTLMSRPDKKDTTKEEEDQQPRQQHVGTTAKAAGMALAVWTIMPQAAMAASSFQIQASLAAYGHIFSILTITACLVAERLMIQKDMTPEEEITVFQIDFVYGILAALLIGSGFARAMVYAKGGDFYVHEILFWVKMTFAGIWGGLSIFPTIIFRQRKALQEKGEVLPPLSDALVTRLHKVVNAEISAILTIPLLASLMSQGVGYSPDLPWVGGAVLSVAATIGSFYLYGKQALTWSDDKDDAGLAVGDN